MVLFINSKNDSEMCDLQCPTFRDETVEAGGRGMTMIALYDNRGSGGICAEDVASLTKRSVEDEREFIELLRLARLVTVTPDGIAALTKRGVQVVEADRSEWPEGYKPLVAT